MIDALATLRSSFMQSDISQSAYGALRAQGSHYADMAGLLRALTIGIAARAGAGRPESAARMADVATVLLARHLKFDPNYAKSWPDRDRLVLSAGHGSPLLYALLHLTGYPQMSTEQLQRFRQLESITPGYPEVDHTPGVEATSGPLGQGLANAVGMALAERMLAARYGKALIDHHTYVMVGASCLTGGISHEVISLAGHLKLDKLVVLFDDERDAAGERPGSFCADDQLDRFAGSGWSIRQVDGHDYDEIAQALDAARDSHRPTLIACRTSADGSGAGAPWTRLDDIAAEPVRRVWRLVGDRGCKARAAWEARLAALAPDTRNRFLREINGELAANVDEAIRRARQAAQQSSVVESTQAHSQKVLDILQCAQANLVGGSTEPAGGGAAPRVTVTQRDFSGREIRYEAREHSMAGVMNGIALHGGFIPYGQTVLAFSDYSRPAIRLSALMRRRVVYIMTHDSICLGSEGPTCQAVEQLAALRAIPGLQVIRPADAVETVEAWEVALRSAQAPSVLCLSARKQPPLRTAPSDINLVARGGYVLHQAREPRAATIIASGSEVSIAMEAAYLFSARGIDIAVVSMPCFSLFERQPRDYQERVLGSAPRLAIEAGVRDGWDRWIGADGDFIGMSGFGASGAPDALYRKFGLTAEHVVAVLRQRLEARPARHQ
jgi:transketolase